MSQNNTTFHLTAFLEELTDINLADVRNRRQFRREVLDRLDELERKIVKTVLDNSTSSEGLHLSAPTLGKIGSKVLSWFVTATPFLIYELVKVLAPLFLHK